MQDPGCPSRPDRRSQSGDRLRLYPDTDDTVRELFPVASFRDHPEANRWMCRKTMSVREGDTGPVIREDIHSALIKEMMATMASFLDSRFRGNDSYHEILSWSM
jgi:hypothetical protein